jgi:hypothetical protein
MKNKLNKILVYFLLTLSDILKDTAYILQNSSNKLINVSKKTCLHSNTVPHFYETMKFEFTAGRKCKDCDQYLKGDLSLEEKKQLYLELFDYMKDTSETDTAWVSLRDHGGFNL